MDPLSAVLDSDLDDFVAGKVGTDRGILTALSDNVGFVGLCWGWLAWEQVVEAG